MEVDTNLENQAEKYWPINWKNNKFSKLMFVSEWVILLSLIPAMIILFPRGDGSGAAAALSMFFIFLFFLCVLIQLISTIRIKKDKIDKLFIIANLFIFLVILLPKVYAIVMMMYYGLLLAR